jgi:type IV pilus assembly protein PilQ
LVQRLLSERGSVIQDERTSTLIIKDIPSVVDEAIALLEAIDTQTPQVLIEAKIVEANLDFSRELGTEWSIGSQPLNDGFDSGSGARRDLGGQDFRFYGDNSLSFSNPIKAIPTATGSLSAFLLDEKLNLEVKLQAQESSGEGKVISSPRIVTMDNRQALIEQGVSIPFQTFEQGDAKLEFIDAVLSLTVTPHITANRSIIMNLEVTRNAPDSSVETSTGSPAIAKNVAKTETLVGDGQTLVLGGIYTITKTVSYSLVPYVNRIPVLGNLFKSKRLRDERKELLIFVTPRILADVSDIAAN